MSGPVHHQPVTAGVFVPGLAQAELRDPDMSHLMRQRTLTLGQSSSQESLAALPSPRQLFTPQSSSEALSPPARMASPVQPVLGTLPSQLSLASTMQYPAAAASPAQTLADPATPVPTVVTIPSPSMERVWPDNQLGDSQVNPPTPPFEPLHATLSFQQQSQQHLSGNTVPAVPAATTPAQQALLAPVNQTPSAAPAASTTPAQQASPAPVNQTPPTAPAASTTPVQQVSPAPVSKTLPTAPAASTTPAQQASPAPVNQTPPTAPAASTTPVQQVSPAPVSKTPPTAPAASTTPAQQASPAPVNQTRPTAPAASTTPVQQVSPAPVNQTPPTAPAASTTPAQQASPAPVNQTPPTAPAASTTPVQQVPPGQASQSSAVTGADKAPVTPSQSTGGDGSGQPDMTSTMYTDGTYWKTLVRKYSKHHPFYHSNMCGLLWT